MLEFSPKKIFPPLLFVFLTFAATGAGYGAVQLWQRSFSPLEKPEDIYAGWQVYLNENYRLGLRYPQAWEAKEVTPDFVVFDLPASSGQTAVRDYVTLEAKATGDRPKTACEENHLNCSFYANDIYGEETTTPDAQAISFSNGGNDFTLTFHKYGDKDFSKIFSEMGKSLRFVPK